ncbi:MAG: AAA family ATPase [Acidimicrobiales bacterium]|nr:AAA family ATPase [Acidimicrobiales bacterium]
MSIGEGDRRAWTAAILRVLAAVAPEHRGSRYDVSGSGPTAMAWLGVGGFYGPSVPGGPSGASWITPEGFLGSPHGDGPGVRGSWPPSPTVPVLQLQRSPEIDALAHYDAMTPGTPNLSLGWLWASGTAVHDGQERRFVRPLVSRGVQLQVGNRGVDVWALEEWNLWPLAADDAYAAELEQTVALGGGGLGQAPSPSYLTRFPVLQGWVDDVLRASGVAPVESLAGPRPPAEAPADRLEVVVGFGIFTEGSNDLLRPRETLSAWAVDPGIGGTAFASLYLGPRLAPPPSRPGPPAPPTPLHSPLPLSASQQAAVRHAHGHEITVVSGPPGTGKSQTAAAVASDAVARGQRVLIATQSSMAADVLAELLDRAPGPTPVLFGGGRRAGELATKVGEELGGTVDHGSSRRWSEALGRHRELLEATYQDLGDVAALEAWAHDLLSLGPLERIAPALLAPGSTVDVAEVRARLTELPLVTGPFARRRRSRRARALRELVGADPSASDEELRRALEVAERRDRARRADRRDRELAERRWRALIEAEQTLLAETGRRTSDLVGRRVSPDARRAVVALSTALRAGRARRRAHLARVDVRRLTDALPLWIGTLGEIEALLPAVAGAFDLVVLDEASMIEQSAASAALLRARRAVVIGDPRQLRFVSFLADREVDEAVAGQGCGWLADRLDLRRVSAFDLAASGAPSTFLDEHFRSVPHLIGFSADRFYGGRVRPVTRHPANDGVPAIEVHRLDGVRDGGVNEAEVAAASALVADLVARGVGSVGVISPHRPQVDRLRAAVAAVVPDAVLQEGRVRVATVHGFQGSECDVVIASFGLSDGEGRGRRFLEDPHLFNVLVTRARQRMIVLSSVDDPPPGLLAEYLRWASSPPPVPADVGPADAWTEQVATAVRDQGVAVHPGYRVGPWVIDLVVGDGAGAVAAATRVHPDGPDAHVRRHLALQRAGWRQAEAFPSDEPGAAVRAALDLVARAAG